LQSELAKLIFDMAYFKEQIAELIPELEAKFSKPWLILLEGDLGAGKTTWAQEFVKALGGDSGEVKSPTFLKLLCHKVGSIGQLVHIDAYRIEEVEEFLRLGIESYEHVNVWVVEWPEIFLAFLRVYPEMKSLFGLQNFVRIRFSVDASQPSRVASVEWGKL
jgi:tRNA threonylcarbamoyladenosine biosynthesis protein TsaE